MAHNVPVTIEEFKEAMPAHVRKAINPGVMDIINKGIADPEVLAVYRENVIGLTSVMREGRFKMNDYLSAVRFVSHKLLGDSHIQAWSKTFPERYNDMVQRGDSRSEIGSVCSRYAGSKLVVELLGQTMMPTHILNAPLYQKAINHLAELMLNAKSEKVQSDSAAKLVDALKPPETQKVQLDIGMREDETIKALRETTLALVKQQRGMILDGSVSVKAIAQSKLLNHDPMEEGVIK